MTVLNPVNPAWSSIFERIRQVQIDIMRQAPFKDAGLVPNPAARPQMIERAERRLGRRLPPSYRAFLAMHDGWPRFFDGATLLGTAELGKSSYADLAQAVFEAAHTPVPVGGPPSSKVRGYPGDLIPFGIDPAGTTLFAFDPNQLDPSGEMGVIAWIHEIGIRAASFSAFLLTVLEFLEADASALRTAGQCWQKTA